MSLAERIPAVLAARARRSAARLAERAERDAFIVTQFALLGTRFDGLLRSALGRHSAFTLSVVPRLLTVQGRTFATLTVDSWQVQTGINGAPQTVTFTPLLDFRQPDQFGLIECALDFDFQPRPALADRTARTLVEQGIQLRGKRVGSLLVPRDDQVTELTADDLEDAFSAWWLR